MVNAHGRKPYAAPQSPRARPTAVGSRLRCHPRGPGCMFVRPLQGDEFAAAYVSDGSAATLRRSPWWGRPEKSPISAMQKHSSRSWRGPGGTSKIELHRISHGEPLEPLVTLVTLVTQQRPAQAQSVLRAGCAWRVQAWAGWAQSVILDVCTTGLCCASVAAVGANPAESSNELVNLAKLNDPADQDVNS